MNPRIKRWLVPTLLATVALVFAAWEMNGQDQLAKAKPESAVAPFAHVVIFHFKSGVDKKAADEFIADAHKMLGKIPAVKSLWCGKPSEKAKGNTGAQEFEIGLICTHENEAGLKQYLEHALHVEFANKWVPKLDMAKLKVFDFIDAKQ